MGAKTGAGGKMARLVSWFDGRPGAMVALSGGVDSALVAHAAFLSLGGSAVAVTADYKTLSADELESATSVAREIGIRHVVIRYTELENPDFVRNDRNRCFYCRTELASRLLSLARSMGIRDVADGTNADDLGDYRPGMAAMRDGGIHSPLVDVGMTKAGVRAAARAAGLSVHDRPSNSCLASRIPWGQAVTAERLARIELAERFVRQLLGAPRQVRVRDVGGAARIEVLPADIPRVVQSRGAIQSRLAMIGFTSVEVDPDGYSPGKLNVIAD